MPEPFRILFLPGDARRCPMIVRIIARPGAFPYLLWKWRNENVNGKHVAYAVTKVSGLQVYRRFLFGGQVGQVAFVGRMDHFEGNTEDTVLY